jgi:hypothetical protein
LGVAGTPINVQKLKREIAGLFIGLLVRIDAEYNPEPQIKLRLGQ